MVILWGLADDRPLEVVKQCLGQLGTETLFIDQRRAMEYTLELDIDGRVSGTLTGPGVSLALDSTVASAVYLRQYNFEQLDTFANIHRGSEPWRLAAQFEDAFSLWCELTDAKVVNRPSAMGSNSSKPYQADIIRELGFLIPDTLITTDPNCVDAFRHKHGRIIYKSISSCRSIVSQFTEMDMEMLEDVTCCPTQFQQLIEGTDYRVHVLGDRVFVCRITCPDDDYRYSDRSRLEPATLPDEIGERCVGLTERLGLMFSGIDLRLSHEGRWYCFEVNTSPGYTFFETEGAWIGLEVATFLSRA